MGEASEPRVPCPSCGARYKWVAEVAGRKIKCRCGAVLRMPREAGGTATLERPAAAPSNEGVRPAVSPAHPSPPPAPKSPPPAPAPAPAAPPDESYDLELSELTEPATPTPVAAATSAIRPASGSGRCPSCGQPVKPNAVICIDCGYNLQSGHKIETATGEVEASGGGGRSPAGAGLGSTAFMRPKPKAQAQPQASTLVLLLKIFAFILNGLLVCIGLFSLITLNPCGIICLLATGAYNIMILAKGAVEGVTLVFAIICNALTLLMGLLTGVIALMFVSGALNSNPQVQTALQAQHFPPHFMQFIGLFVGMVAVLLLLASLTTFATVMMSRER